MSDGSIAFVSVTGADTAIAIDMRQLAVVGRISVGGQPMGPVLLESSPLLPLGAGVLQPG